MRKMYTISPMYNPVQMVPPPWHHPNVGSWALGNGVGPHLESSELLPVSQPSPRPCAALGCQDLWLHTSFPARIISCPATGGSLTTAEF